MFKASKNMRKDVGGRRVEFRKGDPIPFDEETIRQNFEEGDYETESLPEIQEEEEESE